MYQAPSNPISVLLSMGNSQKALDEGDGYSSPDCTLSLGTPSTRMSTQKKRPPCLSSFGWNILPSRNAPSPTSGTMNQRGAASGGGDPLLVRRCANCDTTTTPLWRNGPRGPKSLCNACGIRFKKEERRATAVHHVETRQLGYVIGSAWAQQCNSPNEFRFMEDDDASNHGIPFLP